MSLSAERSKAVFFDAAEIIGHFPKVEQHCHTNFTDGKDSVEEMVLAAIRKGLSRIIITEHIQKKSAWFEDFIKQVESCQSKYSGQIEVHYGFESKVINYQGELDLPEGAAKTKEAFILGSVHGYPLVGKSNIFYEFDALSREKALEFELKLVEAIAKNKLVDVIAHPLGVFTKNYGPAPESAYLQIVKIAQEEGKALELNYKYDTDIRLWLKLCSQHNVKLNLGSDAHSVHEVGKITEVKI